MNLILVVEENPELSENIAEILELADYYVATGKGGLDGFEKAVSVAPSLIICDLLMPAAELSEFLRALYEEPRTRDLPVLLLDGVLISARIRELIGKLNTVILHKPFTREELLDAVTAGLAKRAPRSGN